MSGKFRTAIAWMLAVTALGACAKEPAPVAALRIEPAAIELVYPAFVELELSWEIRQPLAGLEGVPRVSLHLRDAGGTLVRTFDQAIPFEWLSGRTETHGARVFQSALSRPLAPGDYILTAGLYDGAGHRWPIETAGPARVSVRSDSAAEPGEGYPRLLFSEGWLAVEPGKDLQVLGRRWLQESGVLRLGEVTGPGVLWLSVGIPGALLETQEMVVESGGDQPAVDIVSGCGGTEVTISGRGVHEVEIPIPAPDPGPQDCEISFTPNYRVRSIDTPELRSLALEVVAWSPGARSAEV